MLGFVFATLSLAMQSGVPELAVVRVEQSGSGRPASVKAYLLNTATRGLDLWDPKNSEGSVCPSLVVRINGGLSVALHPRGIERSGMPSIVHLQPGESLAIELRLEDLVPDSPIPPGHYEAEFVYRNKLPGRGRFHDVWTGEVRSRPFSLDVP
jgi:hypothetical protein